MGIFQGDGGACGVEYERTSAPAANAITRTVALMLAAVLHMQYAPESALHMRTCTLWFFGTVKEAFMLSLRNICGPTMTLN